MQKQSVKLGEVYHATVSGKITKVRVACNHPSGRGWTAVNLKTGREVRILTAGRLWPVATDAAEHAAAAREEKS